jgi:hypothetical protein
MVALLTSAWSRGHSAISLATLASVLAIVVAILFPIMATLVAFFAHIWRMRGFSFRSWLILGHSVFVETSPLVLLPRIPHFCTLRFTTMTCYRLIDLFCLHRRLHAGIVDRYIDPSIIWTHGFKHGIAVGLDDFRSLSLVGPHRLPYAVLLTYIADLRRSIPELFDIYHTNFQALGPMELFKDEVIAHSHAVKAVILNGLDRFHDIVGDAVACIKRDIKLGNCRLKERRDTQDAIVTHALECFRMVVTGALDGHHGFVQFRCLGPYYFRCICDTLYLRARRLSSANLLDHKHKQFFFPFVLYFNVPLPGISRSLCLYKF